MLCPLAGVNVQTSNLISCSPFPPQSLFNTSLSHHHSLLSPPWFKICPGLVPRLHNRSREEGRRALVTEFFGVHALILFTIVMTTIYAYVIINHTITSHHNITLTTCTKTKSGFFFCFVFLLMDPSQVCHLSNINGSIWKQILFPNPVGCHTNQRTKKMCSQLLFFL